MSRINDYHCLSVFETELEISQESILGSKLNMKKRPRLEIYSNPDEHPLFMRRTDLGHFRPLYDTSLFGRHANRVCSKFRAISFYVSGGAYDYRREWDRMVNRF